MVSNATFSKYLGPGLRLGWLEAPAWLRDLWVNSGYILSGGSPNHYTSAIVGTALKLGLVKQHVESLRRIYKVKFTYLFHTFLILFYIFISGDPT